MNRSTNRILINDAFLKILSFERLTPLFKSRRLKTFLLAFPAWNFLSRHFITYFYCLFGRFIYVAWANFNRFSYIVYHFALEALPFDFKKKLIATAVCSLQFLERTLPTMIKADEANPDKVHIRSTCCDHVRMILNYVIRSYAIHSSFTSILHCKPYVWDQ